MKAAPAPAPPARPPLFAELIGQDAALANITRALGNARLPHAYLFEGPEGVGKRAAAIALGAAVACSVKPWVGCGTCAACVRVAHGNHPDVRWFAPDGAQIKIAQAQEIVALASERPHEAAARVIIIDQADRLNPAAANCLLKTLEEPAAGNNLVLITAAPEKLLPTIRSRAQRVRFVAVAPTILARWLTEKHAVPADNATLCAVLADGSVSGALDLAKGERHEILWRIVSDVRAAAGKRDVSSVFATAGGFTKEDRQQLGDALELLTRLYRDVLVSAAGAPELSVFTARKNDLAPLVAAAAGSPSLAAVRKALLAVNEASAALAGNVNPTTTLEMLMFRLRGLESKVS